MDKLPQSTSDQYIYLIIIFNIVLVSDKFKNICDFLNKNLSNKILIKLMKFDHLFNVNVMLLLLLRSNLCIKS